MPFGCNASIQVTFIAEEFTLFAVTFLGADGSKNKLTILLTQNRNIFCVPVPVCFTG